MADEKLRVVEAVQGYLDAYSRKDVDGCVGFVAERTPVLLLGTNDDEIVTDRETFATSCRRDFSMMDNISFGEVRYRHVEAEGNLASVLLELPLSYETEGAETRNLFRFAFTLVRESGAWKISSGLTSVPFKSGTYSF